MPADRPNTPTLVGNDNFAFPASRFKTVEFRESEEIPVLWPLPVPTLTEEAAMVVLTTFGKYEITNFTQASRFLNSLVEEEMIADHRRNDLERTAENLL